MSKNHNKSVARSNSDLIVSLALIMLTTLGTTIPLYMNSSSQIAAMHKETYEQVNAIREDIKDFHTRLALQDLEFKMHLKESRKEKYHE